MTSARKPRVLIAGDFDSALEDAIFRQSRLSGVQCARVSGHTAWEKMLEKCRFDAVIIGLPHGKTEIETTVFPDVKMYVVSSKRTRRKTGGVFYQPEKFARSLPAIISEITGSHDIDSAPSKEDRAQA